MLQMEDIKDKLLEAEKLLIEKKKEEFRKLSAEELLKRLPKERLKEIEQKYLPEHVLRFMRKTRMEVLGEIAKYPKNRMGYLAWLGDGHIGDYTEFLQLHVYYARFLVPLIKTLRNVGKIWKWLI